MDLNSTAGLSGLDQITQAKNPSKSELANDKLSSDRSFFLRMLTTQLQNQDPTEPMDVSQMTQQIAQYSGVEQQVQTNANLEKLLTQQKQSVLSTAVSYIGKEVETEGNTGTLFNGQATFSYALPVAANSAQVTITNSAGQAVFNGNAPLKKGRNVVVWDGVNSFNGNTMPAGNYTITLTAKDATGKDIPASTYAVGIVNTVETNKDGVIKVTVGDVTVDFDDIVAVREATPIITQPTGNAA
jgi:flagellar basal-body rod modification protein FlgD